MIYSAYRYITDYPGTCAEWIAQGESLVDSDALHCGQSLLANEYESLVPGPTCTDCVTQYCATEGATCLPGFGPDHNPIYPRCDSLIRCLRDECRPGDADAKQACLSAYADCRRPGHGFASCVLRSCRDACD